MAAVYSHCDVLADFEGTGAAGGCREWVATHVLWRLAQHGFCTLRPASADSWLPDALDDVARLRAEGRFAPPPLEVAVGLLGAEGSAEVCELGDAAGTAGPGLAAAEALLEALRRLLGEHAGPHLGVAADCRSAPLVHVSRAESGRRPQLGEAECHRWLGEFARHTIMAVLLLGPAAGGGSLDLRPFGEDDSGALPLRVQLEPGAAVLLRADLLQRRSQLAAGSVVLSCFFGPPRCALAGPLPPPARGLLQWCKRRLGALREELGADLGEGAPDAEDLDIPPAWRLAMGHLYARSAATQVSIASAACRFPNSFSPESFRVGVEAGADFAVEIPRQRFKWSEWYDESLDGHQRMKSYTKHGIFVDGAEFFDHRMFGISVLEAQGMDPTQCFLLETGYEALHRAGHRKRDLMHSRVGVYVGQGFVETPPSELGAAMGGTGVARAVACGRISFALGMQGPCCTIDAHGATAFMCLEVGFQSLRTQPANFKTALAGAVMLNFSPLQFVSGCAAGYLSPLGRCCTFDASAAGYVKGEGCGFACLKLPDVVDGQVAGEEDERLGFLAALEASSLGRAARLGAPNGATEQQVVVEAMRAAELAPLSVDLVECFGDGALLSDAVEASCLARCLRFEAPGTRPLALGAAMSQVGFMREAAGFAQLLRLLESLRKGAIASNVHLRVLNPHVDEASLESLRVPGEAVPCRLPSNFAGVTSRGLGGTVTHAVVGVHARETPAAAVEEASAARIAFWPGGGGFLEEWREPADHYAIAGSWAGWAAQPMEEEGDGVYGLTVALRDDLVEEFQIWLDGDPLQPLHPPRPSAPSGTPALGPACGASDQGRDFCWAMDGRVFWAAPARPRRPGVLELLADEDVPRAAPGACGDRYRIRLRVAGKWRVVDWERLGGPVAPGADETLEQHDGAAE